MASADAVTRHLRQNNDAVLDPDVGVQELIWPARGQHRDRCGDKPDRQQDAASFRAHQINPNHVPNLSLELPIAAIPPSSAPQLF
jgi:hypothetical protein